MGSLLRAMIVAVAAASVLKSAAAAPPTVVMYETRRLDGPTTYWRASYELAAAYASRHGHNFVLYTLPELSLIHI